MSAVSSQQVRAIHALKGRAGLDEASYRDLLMRAAGVSSSTALTREAAIGVIDRLKVLSGQRPERTAKAGRALALEGPFVGICRALWISGWHLGVVEDRHDTALVAFVRRQTGIDHLGWVRDWDDARKVIEALKAWLKRETGVQWPPRRDGGHTLMKIAVIRAQLRLLGDSETRIDVAGDLDELMSRLGARVREAGR